MRRFSSSSAFCQSELLSSFPIYCSQALSLCGIGILYCQLFLLPLCCVYFGSLSVWPGLPTSLSLLPLFALRFPSVFFLPCFFSASPPCLPRATFLCFATWPVNFCLSLSTRCVVFTGCYTHTHNVTETCRYTHMSAGGGARWGGATISGRLLSDL